MTDWQLVAGDVTLACGAIVAFGAAAASVYQLHRKAVMPVVESLHGIWVAAVELASLVPVLTEIAHEFRPNGGHSMKDYITRVDNGMFHNRTMARTLLESDKIGRFETDDEGRCVWTNSAYRELCGLSADECLGLGWYNAIEITDRPVVAKQWAVAAQGSSGFSGTYHFSRVGKPQRVHCHAVFSRSQAGLVVGSIGTVEAVDEFH